MKRILTVLCCGLALASCSSHGGGLVPSAGGSPGFAVANVPGPPAISAAFIRSAGHISTPNVPLREVPHFLKKGHSITPMSTALPGDLEQVGVAINPGGPYAGVFAAQTAYTNNLLQIGFPAGASGTSQLFAPLIIPSNKSCLGTGEIYSNPGTGTSASFFVVDVCAGSIPFATPINTLFAQTYTRISARGVPELLSLVFTTDAVPTVSSAWYAMLYNYTAARWDIITQKTGISGSGTGVSTWLSEFVPGQCPSTPPIAADTMYLYNATSGSFEVMAPTMAHTTTSVFTTAPTCYVPDGTGPASFAFAVSVPNSSWGSVATPPTPQITEFGVTANSALNGIAAGSDGNLWFTEQNRSRVGRITPGGTITEFPILTAGGGPEDITAGPDGNLWFTEILANKIGRITTNGTVTEFPVTTANSFPDGIAAGPDGNLWFAEFSANKIGRITPSGTVTEFTVPTANAKPHEIVAGPDGNLWFTEYLIAASKIGRITPSGSFTEFLISPPLDSQPESITAGSDGNLWFTESSNNAKGIGRITPGGTVTEFPTTTSTSRAHGITSGPDGNLWFAESGVSKIGKITPSGSVSEFTIPTGNSFPVGIALGPDGNLWFVENSGDAVGRITP